MEKGFYYVLTPYSPLFFGTESGLKCYLWSIKKGEKKFLSVVIKGEKNKASLVGWCPQGTKEITGSLSGFSLLFSFFYYF